MGGLYLLNGSLLFGGYLQAYDFFNKSVIPVTPPTQYLSPIYQSQLSEVSWCTLQLFNGVARTNQSFDAQVGNVGVGVGVSTVSVNDVVINVNAHRMVNEPREPMPLIDKVIMELRLR